MSNKRKVKVKEGEIESFMIKGTRNPCNCGSNLFHQETDGQTVFGVCNACHRDIYEIDEPITDDYVYMHKRGDKK